MTLKEFKVHRALGTAKHSYSIRPDGFFGRIEFNDELPFSGGITIPYWLACKVKDLHEKGLSTCPILFNYIETIMTIKEFEIQYALGALSYDMKGELAKNSDTPTKILSILSTDKNWAIRWHVAANLNTPVEVLTRLSRDEHDGIRHCIAYNSNTPTEVLTKLSTDENRWVRYGADSKRCVKS